VSEQARRVAIVTGAAQGIGRAFALRFARDGFCVAIADTNREQADAVAAEIAASGGEAIAVATDVADEAACCAMAAAAEAAFGRIDVLVNNAALWSRLIRKPFWEIDVAEWDRVMAVNVRGVWLAMKAVVPAMRAQGGGSIINLSSNTFLGGRPGFLHYVGSKGAVIGMTRSAARELGPFNIRVNCILPGRTTTEVESIEPDPARAHAVVASQAIGRPETPDDLVGTAAFLASGDSRFMTGQSLTVDGGSLFL
jgi:3-oxoacyl-[acyl-carrier protein] reductase